MRADEFRNLLKNSKDKLSELKKIDEIKEYGISNYSVLCGYLSECLTEDELIQVISGKVFNEDITRKIVRSSSLLINTLKGLNMEQLLEYIQQNKEFLNSNGIKPCDIIMKMSSDKQIQIATKLKDTEGFSFNEKCEIIALMDKKAKMRN